MVTIMMTVISVCSEAAVEELRRLLLLLLGCAVQVITRSYDHHGLMKVNNDEVFFCFTELVDDHYYYGNTTIKVHLNNIR